MPVTNYEVTLKFRIGTDDPKGLDPKVAKMLGYRLTDWNDGRRSFETEMIQHGLIELLHAAVKDTIEQAMIELYEQQVVDHGNGRRTSRWHLESEKKFAAAKKPWITWEPTVEITECP
jgi:hypothetical protein